MFNKQHFQQINQYINRIKLDILRFEVIDNIEFLSIPQGIWNFNYLVKINHRKLVFKLYPQNERLNEGLFFKNSGEKEFQTLKFFELEHLDIAPKAVLFDDRCTVLEYPALIYEYVEGKNLSFTDSNVKQVAQAFAKLHKLSIPDSDFLLERTEDRNSLINRIEEIRDEYQRKYGETNPDLQFFADCLEKVRKKSPETIAFEYPKSIIHTDPVPGNFIINGNHLTIIDWQNPMIGDPGFDIWLFLSEAFNLWDSEYTLTQKQKQIFLQEYLRLRNDTSLIDRMQSKSIFYLLEFGLHCLLRYSDYSTKNLPQKIINSRETQFEKYRKSKEIVIQNLNHIIQSN